MNFARESLSAQPYLFVSRECPYEGAKIAEAMGSAFSEIGAFLGTAGIAPIGPPMSIYTGMDPDMLRFRGALPVAQADAAKAAGTVRADSLPAGEAMTVTHTGPYTSLNLTHRALWSHMEAEGIPGTFPIWECYLDDPREVAEKELRTKIYRMIG